MNDPLSVKYRRLYDEMLCSIATSLAKLIEEHLNGVTHIDRVTARAKSPDRFLAKACKTDERGQSRYSEPFVQIQDIIGARVVVFYKSDIPRTEELLKQYFLAIESQTVVPDSKWEFGYFGRHLIMTLPADAVPPEIDLSEAPKFFELQLKTLFQHAWSEAEHDLGYKSPQELGPDHQRRLAFTSAQAWGADEVFEGLVAELAPR